MNRLRILSLVMLAAGLACANSGVDERGKAAPASANTTSATNRSVPAVQLPKVLQTRDAIDSHEVMLPGAAVPKRPADPPAPRPPAAPPARVLVAPNWHPTGVPMLPPAPEVAQARPAAEPSVLSAVASAPPPPPVSPVPAAVGSPVPESQPARLLPSLLAEESAVFCQKQIGRWTLDEARAVLGEPHHQRPAVDDDAHENGHIYSFKDPTNRYKDFELDFGKDSGVLRSVFVYPWNLTWQECRKLWGTNVSATVGNKGRTFYSYTNRHLDVLVDHDGKVISLGLY